MTQKVRDPGQVILFPKIFNIYIQLMKAIFINNFSLIVSLCKINFLSTNSIREIEYFILNQK